MVEGVAYKLVTPPWESIVDVFVMQSQVGDERCVEKVEMAWAEQGQHDVDLRAPAVDRTQGGVVDEREQGQ